MVKRLIDDRERARLRGDAPLRAKAAGYVQKLDAFVANPAPTSAEAVATLKIVARAVSWLIKRQLQ